MASSFVVTCPPAAPRLRPSAPPMDVPDFPLLEEVECDDWELDLARQPKACAPTAPRLRPSAPPVDLSDLPLFELPAAAEGGGDRDGDLLLDESADSSDLGEASLEEEEEEEEEEEAVFVSPEHYLFTSPKAQSACSTSTPDSSPRTDHSAMDRLPQESVVLKQSEAPMCPPAAPRLRPAPPPGDILMMPELDLPPVAEDGETSVEVNAEEEEVVFVLDGFNDDELEHSASDQGQRSPRQHRCDVAAVGRGSMSPSPFGSTPLESYMPLPLEAPLAEHGELSLVGKRTFEDLPHLFVRASSSCSTRAPTPREEDLERAPPGVFAFSPEPLLL